MQRIPVRLIGVVLETVAHFVTYLLPNRWGRRLRRPHSLRRTLLLVPVQALVIFGMQTLAASLRRDLEARLERLRAELGHEPSDEELQAAWLEDKGIDPPTCDIPR